MLAPIGTRRGRTWRLTHRPARRVVLATGRRSKGSPSGAAPPQRPTAAPARAPEADRAIGLALMRYVPDLLRWARRCGVPSRDAQDVAQVALVRAWRAWESCDKPSGERSGWLFVIVARVASDHVRARRVSFELRDPSDLSDAPDDSPLPPETMEEQETIAILEELRTGTTPERWRVFWGYEIEGVTAAVLSKREAIPLGTIYNRLRVARRDIRAAIERRRAQRRGDEQRRAFRRGER